MSAPSAGAVMTTSSALTADGAVGGPAASAVGGIGQRFIASIVVGLDAHECRVGDGHGGVLASKAVAMCRELLPTSVSFRTQRPRAARTRRR